MENKLLKLHLGCGKNYLDGYINIDLPSEKQELMKAKADIYKDIRDLSYFESSVDEIRSHHLLEHFNRQEALKLLLQWSNWLKPGGLLIIETPDFEKCIKLFLESNIRTKFRIARHIFGSHESDWAVHKDFWDRDKFKFILTKLGFEIIKIKQFNSILGKLPKTSFLVRQIPLEKIRRNFAREILEASLVGSEKEILDIWLKQIFNR